MYKLFLSWRYLRTRWIALASIISVMLGVATMIIVNSVMEGFTKEMHDRLHGILSDVVVESVGHAQHLSGAVLRVVVDAASRQVAPAARLKVDPQDAHATTLCAGIDGEPEVFLWFANASIDR